MELNKRFYHQDMCFAHLFLHETLNIVKYYFVIALLILILGNVHFKFKFAHEVMA
jgi:hypothetical protein